MTGLRTLSLLIVSCVTVLCQAQATEPEPDESSYATVAPKELQALPAPERTGSDDVAATALFKEGRAFLKQGDVTRACETFERSRQLNTTVAVLLNLGLCYKRAGRTATSYSYYRRAEVLATLSGDKRQNLAHEDASSLSKLRATLRLQLAEQPEGLDALDVRIDGVSQPMTTWSRPMYIDSGEHAVTVAAPEHGSWQGAVRIEDGNQHVLIVPMLAPVQAPRRLLVPDAPHPAAPQNTRAEVPTGGLGTVEIVALATGGAGVISLGVGLLFGLFAINTAADANRYCTDPQRTPCDPPGVALRADAHAHATRSTVLSLVGAAGIASGVTLWLVAPKSSASSRERASPTVTVALREGGFHAQWIGRY